MNAKRVLCIDDEPHVLSALDRNLRKFCPVVTALGGRAALEVLRQDRDFAVIISDMRMPEMSGAELLAEARVWVPDAVRVLLTGEADLSAVVAAVNEGHIRHYLSKPVERDELRRFIQRAFEEHDEALAERKHRSASVRGGAQLALAVLKTSDPVAAARAERSAATAAQLASAAGLRCADDAELATWLAVVAERLPAGAGDPSLDVLLGETEGQVRMALHENANPTPGRSLLAKVVAGALALDDFAQGRTSLNECQQALGEPLTGFAGGLGLLTRPANVA